MSSRPGTVSAAAEPARSPKDRPSNSSVEYPPGVAPPLRKTGPDGVHFASGTHRTNAPSHGVHESSPASEVSRSLPVFDTGSRPKVAGRSLHTHRTREPPPPSASLADETPNAFASSAEQAPAPDGSPLPTKAPTNSHRDPLYEADPPQLAKTRPAPQETQSPPPALRQYVPTLTG